MGRVMRFYEFFQEVYEEHERTFDPTHTRQDIYSLRSQVSDYVALT